MTKPAFTPGEGGPAKPKPAPSLPPPMEEMEDLDATGLVTFVPPTPMPTVLDPAVQDYELNLYQRLGLTPPNETGESASGQSTGQAPSAGSGESGGDGTLSPPLEVDPAVQDYERNLYQRLGITPPDETGASASGPAPGSDSGGQGRTGSSQTEDPLDSNQAKDETSAQATLPDIGELGDVFGTYYDWIPGVSVGRQSEFSNLDVIRVKQDIETRPLVFQHCFQHSASRQDAMECIYAFPPDFDVDELRYLEQIAERTMPGGWGTTGGREGGGLPAIDSGLLSTVYKIEEHLEAKYGYQIEWGEGIYNADRLEQLYELSQASKHIVDYLDIVYADDPNMTGIAAFRQHFSQNEHGQLEIQLGADAYFVENFENIPEEDAGYYGFVPLGDWRSPEQLRRMYFGSAVDISTIVHEFGHVIDRSRGFTDHLTEGIGPDGESRIFIESRYYGETFGADHIEEFGNLGPAWYAFNLDTYVYREIIEGFVAKQYFVQELWADLFMTAVLDPAVSGEEFEVESIEDIPAHIEIFRTFNDPRPQAPIFKCNVNASCIGRTVEWENTPRAKAAQWYLPIVFRERLSTEGEDK